MAHADLNPISLSTPAPSLIDGQPDRAQMARCVAGLASINSGTYHQAGVAEVAQIASAWLGPLADCVRRVQLPEHRWLDGQGRLQNLTMTPAVVAECRPQAERRVLLSIHLDTVFGPEHPFSSVTYPNERTMKGPGVLDAKGGFVVLLTALNLFEAWTNEQTRGHLGWTVVLNPDEEIGSPASNDLLRSLASVHDAGFVFEPTLPNGAWVHARKGSGNFDLLVRGHAAHAGRDFEKGHNALTALCRVMTKVDALNGCWDGVTVNLGYARSGGAVNVVPDLAIGKINVRVVTAEQIDPVERALRRLVEQANGAPGIHVALHGGFLGPPKPLTEGTQWLIDHARSAAEQAGVVCPPTVVTGGVCDGNKLQAAGLPTLDTLGPVGSGMHSDQETLALDSLVPRALVVFHLLQRLAVDPQAWRCLRKERSI